MNINQMDVNSEIYSMNKNGFIEMKRDVVLSLLKFVNEPRKVKSIMAMCQVIYGWKSHHLFLKIRWERTGMFIPYSNNMNEERTDFIFKVVMVGHVSTGKSDLLLRYVKGEFNPHMLPSIGVDFMQKWLKIDDKILKIQIWDTSGQDRYRAITSAYYRGSSGALVVYDVTNRTTFDKVIYWLQELRKKFADPSIPIVLVGNKDDLRDRKVIPTEEGKGFAQRNGMFFMETSALMPRNVELAFNSVLREVFRRAVIRPTETKFKTDAAMMLKIERKTEKNKNPRSKC